MRLQTTPVSTLGATVSTLFSPDLCVRLMQEEALFLVCSFCFRFKMKSALLFWSTDKHMGARWQPFGKWSKPVSRPSLSLSVLRDFDLGPARPTKKLDDQAENVTGHWQCGNNCFWVHQTGSLALSVPCGSHHSSLLVDCRQRGSCQESTGV